MRRKPRTLAAHVARVVGIAAGCMLLFSLGGMIVCSKYPTYRAKIAPANCAAEQGFEFGVLDAFDSLRWWSSADYTPDGGSTSPYIASAQVNVQTIPEGALCKQYTSAGVYQASHNNDWGCIYGFWAFNDINQSVPLDASEWEGLSFWAKAPGPTNKGFTILLDDNNTAAGAVGSFCRSYTTDGGVAAGGGSGETLLNPATGTSTGASSAMRSPYPDECGNGYFTTVLVTGDWAFYTIPFSSFHQNATPNRVPNAVFKAGNVPGTGLLTDQLRLMTLRMSKEAEMNLWLANLAFYRKARGDAGAGATK